MRLERVGKRYGIRQPWIVRDVTLDIAAGRLVRLEGRNGSGKSTLLRVIAGVSVPSRGKVTGRPATGYVPERFPPGLPFSARDYLTHLGQVHGLAGRALRVRIDECLDRIGGSEFAAVPLRTMSKGMCQKVAVAQALLPRPGLLVLDEAWTGLDMAARAALDDAVAERLASGGAVVFVDHDPRRLAGLGADRWQVSRGRVAVVADAEPGPAAGVAVAAPGGRETVIEMSGYPAAMPVPAGLPGVLSVSRAADRLTIRAEPARSGAVLRALLGAGDDVEVRSVREEPGPRERQRGAPGGWSEGQRSEERT